MNNDEHLSINLEDKIDLKELFSVFWSGKIKILLITAIFAISSVMYSLSLPNQYKATAILAPSTGGVSDTFSRLGGFASFAGISLNESSSGNDARLAIEIMQSWSFIEDFIAENNLAPMLFAVEGWEEQENKIIFNNDIYDAKNNNWINEGELPSSWDLFQSFTGKLSVEDDKRSGLTIVTIEYISPQIAKNWVDLYVSSINKYMQARKIQMVSKNIEYLDEQVVGNSNSEMKEVFFAIISEQVKEKMMAEATPDYAFVTVSPSMVPEKKSQPNRALICILGTIVGGIFSIFLVLILHYGRNN